VLEQLLAEYPEDVRLVFRHFPLPSHPLSLLAVQAVEAAGLQGKYWELSDAIFAQQTVWSAMDPTAFEAWLVEQATALSLDTAKFSADMKSDALVKKARDYQQAAYTAGVSYTPFVVFNGRTYQNIVDLSNLNNLRFMVELIKGSQGQFTSCPPTVLEPGKKYNVTLETEEGNIVIRLDADKVPVSANAFAWLVQQGWYDDTTFYYIQRGEGVDMEYAITGDRTETGAGTPGFIITTEIGAGQSFDQPGKVGFLNGSQLFFTYNAVPTLDGRYTQLGEVVQGMDILLNQPATGSSADSKLVPGLHILRVTIAAE